LRVCVVVLKAANSEVPRAAIEQVGDRLIEKPNPVERLVLDTVMRYDGGLRSYL